MHTLLLICWLVPLAGWQVGLDLLHFLTDSIPADLMPGPVAFRTMMVVLFLLQSRAPTLSRMEPVRTDNSFQQVFPGPSSCYQFQLEFAVLAHVGSFQLDLLSMTTSFFLTVFLADLKFWHQMGRKQDY